MGLLDWLFQLYGQRLNCLALPMLWLVYDRVKFFCGSALNFNPVVCSMPNIIVTRFAKRGLIHAQLQVSLFTIIQQIQQ